MGTLDTAAALRELAAQVAQYPAASQDTAQALAWVHERLTALAATPSPVAPPGPHCARCRANVATELRRQIFMN